MSTQASSTGARDVVVSKDGKLIVCFRLGIRYTCGCTEPVGYSYTIRHCANCPALPTEECLTMINWYTKNLWSDDACGECAVKGGDFVAKMKKKTDDEGACIDSLFKPFFDKIGGIDEVLKHAAYDRGGNVAENKGGEVPGGALDQSIPTASVDESFSASIDLISLASIGDAPSVISGFENVSEAGVTGDEKWFNVGAVEAGGMDAGGSADFDSEVGSDWTRIDETCHSPI